MRLPRSLAAATVFALQLACGNGPSATPGAGDANAVSGGNTGNNATSGGDGNAAQASNVVLADGNVVLHGSGYDALEGKTLRAALMTLGGRVIGSASVPIEAGAFALPFLVPISVAYDQHVAYYVDVNGNAFCNVAPLDVGGNVRVPADGAVRVAYDATTRPYCEALGTWTLTVAGDGWAAWTGQYAVVAVRDAADNTYVLGPVRAPLTQDGFKLTFPALMVTDHAYEVRAYVEAAAGQGCQQQGYTVTTGGAIGGNVSVSLSPQSTRAEVCTDFPPAAAN